MERKGEGWGTRHSRCLWVVLPLGITSQSRGRVPALGSPNLLQPRSQPRLAAGWISLSLSLQKDLGMKISVHIEAHIYFYFITVPWLFQEIFLQDSHGASLEGTRVSLIGTVPSLPSCRWNGDHHPLRVLHTCSDTERLHIWTS